LRLALLKEVPDDPNLRRQWNELAARLPQPQVFYTYEWALAVQRAYGKVLHPLIFLARDEQDELYGVAALAVDDEGKVSFLCATTGDYCDFLSAGEYKAAFVAGVLAELKKRGLASITFTNLPADSDTVAAIRQASSQEAYHYYARTAYVCTQVLLKGLERRPDGNLVLPRKKMVRRFLNAMGREAPVRFNHARRWDELRPIVPSFMRAHVTRFLATGRISNMVRPERQAFLTELAELLSENGWVTLTRMMSGNNAFAWNYGFQYGGSWFWYQPTFESELEKYSPGFCMLAKLIEEAAAMPEIKVVDLGLGAEEYKDRVSNQERKTLYITLKLSASKHYREIVRYQASRLVRISPKAETMARAAMRFWQRSRTSENSGEMQSGRMGVRLRELCWLQKEVSFYEWQATGARTSSEQEIRRLSLEDLASAACQYPNEPLTLDYLLRSAARLREGRAHAYGLADRTGRFLHFAWTTDFAGFALTELNAKVDAPSPDAVILFDSWTPLAARCHGYFTQAIEQIANIVREQGKSVWMFSPAANTAAIKGIERAGFEYRYSLVRQRIFGWQRIQYVPAKSNAASVAEVSARV
jgi:CelD/BcsL family acetyltransferase involved in cellulose biosynthesis